MPSNQRFRRRGSIYVVVLGTSMIITVIGLSAVMATRIERRSAEGTDDFAQARSHARSAIEMGMHWIDHDPNWRQNRTSGPWEVKKSIGTGVYTLEGVDAIDANLADSDTDPLVLTGTGFEGDARYKLEVTLMAQIPPLTCLEVALHAGEDLRFDSATVQCNQTISANDDVLASGADIFSDVEAVDLIEGGTYWQTTTTGITPRTMPDSTVFDYYLANGTTIDFASIPSGTIFEALLSPASNPYGAGTTNPQGIYVIDCLGQTLEIHTSRIVGTLVLLNPDPLTSVRGSVNWEPAVANYPALLVSGSMGIEINSDALSESTISTNFNPPGTPYEGVEDTDTLDSYPSLIKGLVYVSGDMSTSNVVTIDGVVVVGVRLSSTGTLNLTYQPTYLDNPPSGFTDAPQMVVADGTWRQVVD